MTRELLEALGASHPTASVSAGEGLAPPADSQPGTSVSAGAIHESPAAPCRETDNGRLIAAPTTETGGGAPVGEGLAPPADLQAITPDRKDHYAHYI